MAASATDASAADGSVAQNGTVPSAENSGDLTEIIVTANKRSESVQKSPAAITALNADALAELGVRSAVDLTKIVPGTEIVEAPGVAQGFIRGVGSNIDDPYVDPGVAINVNGISTPLASGCLMSPVRGRAVGRKGRGQLGVASPVQALSLSRGQDRLEGSRASRLCQRRIGLPLYARGPSPGAPGQILLRSSRLRCPAGRLRTAS